MVEKWMAAEMKQAGRPFKKSPKAGLAIPLQPAIHP